MTSIRDVAQAAGVSISTVSRVLTNSTPVAPETRARVLEAVALAGYRPNTIARALRRGTSQMLGLVVPDITNPFFTEVAAGVQVAAEKLGYNVFLAGADNSARRQTKLIKTLCDQRVDGFIVCPVGDGELPKDLLAGPDGIPCVIIDRGPGSANSDTVTCDNYTGSYMLTRHLIDHGHRHICCIAGPRGLGVSDDRVRGFLGAMRDLRLSVADGAVYYGEFSAATGKEGTKTLLGQYRDTTALVCLSDLIALGSLAYLAEQGIPVPKRVSVAGFDNIQMASLVYPALTTVNQPKRQMGKAAVRLLGEQMSGVRRSPTRVTLNCSLVVRDSTGRPMGQPESPGVI